MLAVLYALALFVLLLYGVHLLWLGGLYLRRGVPRVAVPAHPPPAPADDWPAVTVQLPLYNEPDVAGRLLDACAALRYPADRLEIQVLDDSTDETPALVERCVRRLRAVGVDVVHLRRERRTGFKAGALAAGLARARGRFVAVFDADFVPPPDFLLRTVPLLLADPGLGLVQARWGHLNADGLLTRLQAFALDAHFAVEQAVRHRAGLFMSFNGTAGLWRRACIDDAGGWRADTLTEDLDLSYRAQLRGWRFRFLPDLEVPAELPATVSALRTQQFRWAKGAVETARLLLPPLLRADRPLRVRAAGAFHLTAHAVFPAILLAALLHAPVMLIAARGGGPGPAYFALAGLGLVGFAGFVLVQVLAQRALYPDWRRRLLHLPIFMAGSMGLSVVGTRAFVEALAGRRSPFVRTPKGGARAGRPGAAAWVEAGLAVYTVWGVLMLAAAGRWDALPFQLLFALGFILMTAATVAELRPGRPAPPAPADGLGLARPPTVRTLARS